MTLVRMTGDQKLLESFEKLSITYQNNIVSLEAEITPMKAENEQLLKRIDELKALLAPFLQEEESLNVVEKKQQDLMNTLTKEKERLEALKSQNLVLAAQMASMQAAYNAAAQRAKDEYWRSVYYCASENGNNR